MQIRSIVEDWLRQETFCYADCVVTEKGFLHDFMLVEDRVVIGDRLDTDTCDLTDAWRNFEIEIDGSTYSGGGVTAHSACGWFCKWTAERLDWALVSLDSGAFIDASPLKDGVCFLSDNRARWIVRADNMDDIAVEEASLG